ncbi:hypothetical protein U472_09395 [Orenia metallireducens]|uniref:Winged helix DNA-binding domain-containing protein n=1 Tax=Orenia metallireducens TaxID=1413210 RepID=A0A1C0A7J5_9FIRM|nr:hypothetical protein [Orenia metallireducens]OCL26216.1 hypothetical protein U472_09395 [Orenia metallireducens]
MKLCDNCIKVLSSELSEESVNTLRSSLDLFTSNKEITIRDLWEVTRFGKHRMNKVISELEEGLFLKANQEGRRVYLKLTPIGKRFMELDLENRLSAESDLKEVSDEFQEVSLKTIDEVEDFQEEIVESNNDNTEDIAEESEEIEEKIESEPIVEKKDDGSKDDKNNKKSKPIVWDF